MMKQRERRTKLEMRDGKGEIDPDWVMFALLPFLYPSIGVELMDESLSFPAAKFLQRNAFLYQRRVHATYHEVPDLIFSWSDAGRTRGSRRGLILSEFELQANQHLSLNAFQFADVQTSRGLAPARMTDHLSPVLDLSLNDESSNLAYYYGQNAQDIGLDSSFLFTEQPLPPVPCQ